jgi:transposase-like protein
MRSLPSNISITSKYCDMGKFSGKLEWDGTYIPVKGYKREIPLIWAIDYDTHDIPHIMLATSENYLSCLSFFSNLRAINYPLKFLVCDDNPAVKQAVSYVYPKVIIQTCLKHYLNNIGDDLNIKSSNKYKLFFDFVYEAFFIDKCTKQQLAHKIAKRYNDFKGEEKQYNWMINIMQDLDLLTNYHRVKNAPYTTNLIECYNGHLKDRTKSLRGFKSFYSAYYWLNAYVLQRRFRNLTSCDKPFKHLNGHSSISQTARNPEDLPNIFHVSPTKK